MHRTDYLIKKLRATLKKLEQSDDPNSPAMWRLKQSILNRIAERELAKPQKRKAA